MTVTPPCRFCGSELSVDIPDSRQFPEADSKLLASLARMVGTLAGRACCNRCADYHRSMDDMATTAQRIMNSLERLEDQASAKARESVSRIIGAVIKRAEDHYLISGLHSEHKTFVGLVMESPAYAGHYIRDFDKRALDLARRTHRPIPQPEIEYTY